MDPAVVIVEGNEAGVAKDVAVVPVASFGVVPAPHGDMTHFYNVVNLQEVAH